MWRAQWVCLLEKCLRDKNDAWGIFLPQPSNRPVRHIFAIDTQTCLNGWIVSLRSFITVKFINTNQFKLSTFYFIEFLKKRPKSHQKSKGLEKQSKINKAKKSKKTWTPAHQKSRNHGKNHSVLEASQNTTGHKKVPNHITVPKASGKTHHNQSTYIIYRERW